MTETNTATAAPANPGVTTAFRDTAGQTWVLALDLPTIKRVRTLAGFDFNRLVRDGLEPLADLFTDEERLVNVVYAACKDQADKLGMSDEQFGRRFSGDTIEAAAAALVEAYADFRPSRGRSVIRALAEKMRDVSTAAAALAMERVAAIDPEAVAREMTAPRAAATPSNGSAANSPASAASPPPGGPSAN